MNLNDRLSYRGGTKINLCQSKRVESCKKNVSNINLAEKKLPLKVSNKKPSKTESDSSPMTCLNWGRSVKYVYISYTKIKF